VRRPISEGARARLSALGLVVVLGLLVAIALAGRPAPPAPQQTFEVAQPITQVEPTPTASPSPTAGPPPAPTPGPIPSPPRNPSGEDRSLAEPAWPWHAAGRGATN
jgi:hypothetical protein